MHSYNSAQACPLDYCNTHPLLADGFCVTWTTRDPFSGISYPWAVAGNMKFGTPGIVLEVERVELLSDAFESGSSFIRLGLSILGDFSPLLFALLWANNTLFSQRGL